jgi:hypothetical protein
MKRILFLSALIFIGVGAGSVRAQESVENELELVRKLRDKGWADLAKAKIEELVQRGDPALNAALPLELAEINIAMARQMDPDQRLALFTQARTQLQDFIKQNQGKPQAALASVKLARLTSYHAQAILSRAMREEDTKDKHAKARPAETMFIQAGKDLETAIKTIDAALPNALGALKGILEQEKRQARFDVAINLFDQAKTYIDRSKFAVNQQRSETMDKARKAFFDLRSDESSQNGWLANAWLMKCAMELTARDDVIKYHDAVMKKQNDKTAQPAIQPAVRLVKYFALQDLTLPRADEAETIGDNAIGGAGKVKMTSLDRLHKVQKDGEDWLKTYANYQKTYEGQGVRFELGQAYLTEAFMEQDKKDAKAQAAAKKLFELAGEHFKILGNYDGDLATRAQQLSMQIQYKTVAEGKIELKTFDQFYMKAMIERGKVIATSKKLDDAKPDDQKKFEAERKEHLKEVITALNKALAQAESKTPIGKMDDARYFLSGAYLAYGDAYRAAIVSEALGRARTTRRSAEGAATALQTYSALQARSPDDAVIRRRLEELAAFILATDAWKGDPVMSYAHYHLALAAKREDDAVKAIMHLEKITPDFMDYIYTQGQLVFIAQAAREKTDERMYVVETKNGEIMSGVLLNKTAVEVTLQAGAEKPRSFKTADVKTLTKLQTWYINAAKAALTRMPMYAKDESPSVITMYYFAKLEMTKFMYADAVADLNPAGELNAIKTLNEMSKYTRDLQNQISSLPGKSISPENREQIEFTMRIMLKYADLGIAEAKFRGGRLDEVITATQNVVNDTLKMGSAVPPGQFIKLKDHRVTGDILSLALRASVQKGDVAKGQAILDLMQRLADEKGNPVSGKAVAVLLNDISAQIKAAKNDKNVAAIKTTRESYTKFLDVIAKEYDKKAFDPNAAVMLAHAYSSLEYPNKAAPLFAKVKPPASLDTPLKKKTGKETDKELEARAAIEEETGRYWGIQIEYIRALRACKDKESLKTAEAAADTLLKHPNAKYKLQAMMEKNFLLEDQENYRAAYIEWSQKFMKMPSLKNLSDKEVQKIYFNGYFYMVRTCFEMAENDKTLKNPAAFVTSAANQIFKLENSKSREGWDLVGPKFMDLLNDPKNIKLKKEYDKLKSAPTKTSSSPRSRLGFALGRAEAIEALPLYPIIVRDRCRA